MSDNDHFQEVTHTSWLDRIVGSLKGIVVGLLLFICAFFLLFWNEGRAVKERKVLEEGGKIVISVSNEQVKPENDNKLVHVSGHLQTKETLEDSVFNISTNAIQLQRVVEMYQWHEHAESDTKKNLGGSTTTTTNYSYTKNWSAKKIASHTFKKHQGHNNPEQIPYKQIRFFSKKVTLGAFRLPTSLINSMSNFVRLPVAQDTPIPESLEAKALLHDGGFYIGKDPLAPQIGDVRIRFKVVKPTQVSIIAKQIASTFAPYRAKSNGSIFILKTGIYSADAMIQIEQENNVIFTWALRVLGVILMFLGLQSMLSILVVIADFLPIFGYIVSIATGVILFLIALILSLITIAIAWLAYRPVLGVILLVTTAALIWTVRKKIKVQKQVVAET